VTDRTQRFRGSGLIPPARRIYFAGELSSRASKPSRSGIRSYGNDRAGHLEVGRDHNHTTIVKPGRGRPHLQPDHCDDHRSTARPSMLTRSSTSMNSNQSSARRITPCRGLQKRAAEGQQVRLALKYEIDASWIEEILVTVRSRLTVESETTNPIPASNPFFQTGAGAREATIGQGQIYLGKAGRSDLHIDLYAGGGFPEEISTPAALYPGVRFAQGGQHCDQQSKRAPGGGYVDDV